MVIAESGKLKTKLEIKTNKNSEQYQDLSLSLNFVIVIEMSDGYIELEDDEDDLLDTDLIIGTTPSESDGEYLSLSLILSLNC